jgi:hypothetical protein
VLTAFREVISAYGEEDFAAGYQHFLRDAVIQLHRAGRKEEARRVFDTLRREFPSAAPEPDVKSFIEAETQRNTERARQLYSPNHAR